MRLKSTGGFMAFAIAGLAVLIVVLVLMLLPERHSDNFACYRTADGKIGCKPID